MNKLRLIKGSKIAGGGRKGGGRHKLRKPHPYNELLWKSTCFSYYKTRASTVEEIAQRMTRLSKRTLGYEVTINKKMAEHCILDGRKRRISYGWQLLNVEKGGVGFNRGYVPVLVDVDDENFELFLIEDTDIPYVRSGALSALNTQASMAEITADGLAFIAGTRETMGHNADVYRELSDDAKYLARKIRRLAMNADKL